MPTEDEGFEPEGGYIVADPDGFSVTLYWEAVRAGDGAYIFTTREEAEIRLAQEILKGGTSFEFTSCYFVETGKPETRENITEEISKRITLLREPEGNA